MKTFKFFFFKFSYFFTYKRCSLFNVRNLSEVHAVIKLYVILHKTNPLSLEWSAKQPKRLKCNRRRASL